MKTNKFVFGALCMGLLFSCEKPVEEPKYQSGELSFTATTENVTNGPAVVWKANDAISLLDGENNVKFTTKDSGATATFTGAADINAANYLAMYPYISKLSRSNGKATVTIPASQEAVVDGFDAAANFAVAYTTDKTLKFKNMSAFLKITLAAADDVVSVQIKGNNDEGLAGTTKIGMFEEPTVESDASSSKTVAITGSALDGTFYIVAIPQKLAGGYTLTLTNSEEMKYTVEVKNEVSLTRNAVLELGSFSKIEWVATVNPNPTKLAGVSLLKASFAEADFNIISEPGFEDYPTEAIGYKSSWRGHAEAQTIAGHTGDVAVTCPNPTPGVWFDALLQTVALRPNADYQYSVYVQGGTPHNYTGVICFPLNIRQEIAGPDWAPIANWTAISREFNTGNNYYGDVFCGLWGDAGAFFSIDDVVLIPKGYDKKSMNTASTVVMNEVGNTSFDEVTSVGKAIAWRGTNGKISLALYKATIGGKLYDNAVVITDADNIDGDVNLSRFFKQGGSILPIVAPAEGETIVPNSAFVVGDKTYLHYVSCAVDAEGNITGSNYAGFAISEDGGKTWTKAATSWSGTGSFVQASFCKKGDYYYMVGSKLGRTNTYWANMYVARVEAAKDFTDPTQWEYFSGLEWVAGDELTSTNPSCCLTVGDSGEPAVVYNEKFGRFMMIYRSEIHKGLVYRDADEVDGYWSGEKILTDDDAEGVGVCFAPSVIDETADGDITVFAPHLQ